MESKSQSSGIDWLRVLVGYGAGVVAVFFAVALTEALPPLHLTPTVLFFAAIACVAWFGGIGPALLASFLSCWSLDYFIISPKYSVLGSVADAIRFAAFASVATLVCVLQEKNRRFAEQLRQTNIELEFKVHARTAELTGANWALRTEIEVRRQAETALRVSQEELRGTLDRIAASLKEKEILLRELHHRVKNNLQVISSLFSLQAPKVQDPAAQELFRECRNRVRTMALVHNRLYAADDIARIDLADYYGELVGNLFRSFGSDPELIVPRIHVEDTVLDFDQVIPCGLIVNELLSNSLKYAFPDGRAGEVCIDIRHRDDVVTLTVADDGVGRSPLAQSKTGDGLQIVEALVDQLSGQFEMTNGRGMTYTVTFPTTRNRESHVEHTNPRRRG